MRKERATNRRTILAVTLGMLMVASAQADAGEELRGRLGPPIENPTGTYLVWGDYKVEINQYGGLGRDWPEEIVWEQYEVLKKKAEANAEPPNTIKAVLLVCPIVEATAYKKEGGREVAVGTKLSTMRSDEVKWALEQWRQFAEMIYVYSEGNAWLRTDIKIVDKPLKVRTNENYGFWSGPKREWLDTYIPFERGEYQSYNSIYSDRGLAAGPWGGTLGAVAGVKGCGTSDNLWIARGKEVDGRHGFIYLHEWLNQQASATSNMMPYPDKEALWNLYILEKMGYRNDKKLRDWPWLISHRDVMRFAIRPGMWRRWTPIDPYKSLAIGEWVMFGPTDKPGLAREASVSPASRGMIVRMKMETYTHFDITKASAREKPVITDGTYYFRTYVESDEAKEVRLWAAADERFQLWLNGVMVRDGWGWNYSQDDGQLFEKVTYAAVQKGVNTLVLVLPNVSEKSSDKVEFRVRFCKTDGSGEQPEGVTALATLDGGKEPLGLKELVVHDFKRPTLYTWADVGDDPWLSLPRLDEAALRELTGVSGLKIVTDGAPREDEKGKWQPKQHLFLDVPKGAVASPWMAEPAENNAKLNNDLDYNWKSVAWLRVPGRAGPEKDVLFLRFDVAEPLMHLLRTKGRPANESIVGWVLVERKLAYVVLVNLDIDKAPESELGLLSKEPE